MQPAQQCCYVDFALQSPYSQLGNATPCFPASTSMVSHTGDSESHCQYATPFEALAEKHAVAVASERSVCLAAEGKEKTALGGMNAGESGLIHNSECRVLLINCCKQRLLRFASRLAVQCFLVLS